MHLCCPSDHCERIISAQWSHDRQWCNLLPVIRSWKYGDTLATVGYFIAVVFYFMTSNQQVLKEEREYVCERKRERRERERRERGCRYSVTSNTHTQTYLDHFCSRIPPSRLVQTGSPLPFCWGTFQAVHRMESYGHIKFYIAARIFGG